MGLLDFISEQDKSRTRIKILILSEWVSTEEDGLSSTAKRIKEECEKEKLDYSLIFPKDCYIKEKSCDKIVISQTNPVTEKTLLIEFDPESTVAFIRKSVSDSSKGLYLLSILEEYGVYTINDRRSIEICNNKLLTVQVTEAAGIKNPKTIPISECNRQDLEDQMKLFNGGKYPVILKTLNGEHGKGVMKIDSFSSLYSVLQTMWKERIPILVQEFIEIDYELRIIAMGDSLLADARKEPPKKEFRANGHQGSIMFKQDLKDDEVLMAKKVIKAIGGYWLGIDIMRSKKGNLYLIEANASAGTEGIEKATGINIIKKVLYKILDKESWARPNTTKSGFVEKIDIEGIGKLDAKFDTGNGVTSSIHGEDVIVSDKMISFKLNNKKYEFPLLKKVKVHLGKQDKHTEVRPVISCNIKLGKKKLDDIEFSITTREGTIKELEPVLLSRKVINRLGLLIDSQRKYVLTNEVQKMNFSNYLNEEDKKYSITSEMQKWFDERTAKHISLVQKYAKKIEDQYPDLKGLSRQAESHDASKYKEPEKTPYVYISWQYKMKDEGKDYKIPSDIDGNAATMHHIKSNSHHPEYHSSDETKLDRENRDKANNCIDATKMADLDIAEMCADWLGMSEEKRSNPLDWANKVIDKRWEFSKHQKDLIYKILNNVKVEK